MNAKPATEPTVTGWVRLRAGLYLPETSGPVPVPVAASPWYGLKAGTDTYHHGPARPSRLLFPEQPMAGPEPAESDHVASSSTKRSE